MGAGRLRRATVVVALVMLSFLSACAEGLDGFMPTPQSQTQGFPIDPVLKEFYIALGGQEMIGPAISAIENRENLQCQFTERVLMCFNPAATDVSRFSLYPLGKQLNIQGSNFSVGVSDTPDARIVDGVVIYDKFVPMYDRLFGARYVGKPLTELRINQDSRRVEQFFENAGFYQSLDDPNSPVYLIPYGAFLCGKCSSRLDEYWLIIKATMTDQPFGAQVARLGGPGIFGSPLLKAVETADGMVQQVYTNVIFSAPRDNPSQVRLLPLPVMLNLESQPPVEKISHPQLVYYEFAGGLGHNVPLPFDQFITAHGGRDLAGNPVSEVIQLGDGTLRQCFENYCLIYNPAAVETLKVTMAPLGQEYLALNPPPEELQIRNIFTPEHIGMVISVDKPTLNNTEEQYVRMMVQTKDNGQPMERVEASLLLRTPGQMDQRYNLPPTDATGMTVVVIPPQPQLANGTRLSYEVCLNLPAEQPICGRDSYLIWNIQP